jgi:4-hydroxythreonine-4-phosphate dehydrogenase
MKPLLAITVGDANGIGPEVALKAVASPRVRATCVPVLIGPETVFEFYRSQLHLRARFRKIPTMLTRADIISPSSGAHLVWEPPGLPRLRVRPGSTSAAAGSLAARSVDASFRLIKRGTLDGMVTAPISKRALHAAGIRKPGHTELLQGLAHSKNVAMMLVSPTLKVGLVTIHTPIRSLPRQLSRERLIATTTLVHQALRDAWRIRSPRIAVLGFNPHAGEGGDIGREEMTVIRPAIKRLRKESIRCSGPFPADAFFARYLPADWDAVIAMYHDQGLIPLKMSAKGKGVNVTLGLPFIRTSPDHGTAFEIAGKGMADPSSMIEAIVLAARLVRQGKSPWRNP